MPDATQPFPESRLPAPARRAAKAQGHAAERIVFCTPHPHQEGAVLRHSWKHYDKGEFYYDRVRDGLYRTRGERWEYEGTPLELLGYQCNYERDAYRWYVMSPTGHILVEGVYTRPLRPPASAQEQGGGEEPQGEPSSGPA